MQFKDADENEVKYKVFFLRKSKFSEKLREIGKYNPKREINNYLL